jgi:hypothetical protein
MSNENLLKDLNQKTFDAEAMMKVEGLHWKDYLNLVLADEFVIRRSALIVDGEPVFNQTKEQMIEWIERHPNTQRRNPEDIRTWCDETLGVVTCAVVLEISGSRRRFQNVKIFEKKGKDGKKDKNGDWKCVYWQVTEMPLQSDQGQQGKKEVNRESH